MNGNHGWQDNQPSIYLSYGDWANIQRQNNEAYRQKLHYERKKRAAYYQRQRILGFEIMVISIIASIVAYANRVQVVGVAGLVAAAIGLYVVLTKHMVLIDEYYYECMDKIGMC